MTERKQKQKDQKWSAEVTRNSNALDLEADIFKSESPVEIARSLQRSAERSKRRKSAPFRSAMSIIGHDKREASLPELLLALIRICMRAPAHRAPPAALLAVLTLLTVPPARGHPDPRGVADGKIGLANWTPESFIGKLFKTIGKYVPPGPA